jgi:hypothetical protein
VQQKVDTYIHTLFTQKVQVGKKEGKFRNIKASSRMIISNRRRRTLVALLITTLLLQVTAFLHSNLPNLHQIVSFKTESLLMSQGTDDDGDDSTPRGSTNSPPPPVSTEQQQKMSASQIMQALGTNPRRILLGTSTAAGIALAGNFLGVTSNLLTKFPEESVEATGLDTYFPRGNYKRIRTGIYTFVIPKEWVADTFVELAKAQRQTKSLDLKMSRRDNTSTLPDAAFGPPGRLNKKGVSEQGDTNVSVIVSGGLSGFSLGKTLGSPTDAAEKLLRVSIAPPGSGRTATLVDAFEDSQRVGPSIYQFEYIVDRGEKGPPLRNISVIGGTRNGDKFVTLTVVAPEETWKDPVMTEKLRKIATSFHLTI